MRRLVTAPLLCLSLVAQEKPAPVRLSPLRISPACTIAQDIGISRITLAFSRPAMKGRKIWGGLVPFGQVWRAGANNATVLTLSHAARVAGRDIAAGSYGFFAIPGEKSWTLILNKQPKQWGAYEYTAKEDILRWEVTPQSGPALEYLDYRILPEGLDQATVELAWDKARVGFTVAFDTRAIYWAHLEDALKRAPETDWVPWYQAADYCQKQGLEPRKALGWIEKSLRAGESYWNHETAARILKDAQRLPEARNHLQRAIELSMGKAPKDYTDNLEQELLTWKAAL